MSKLNRFERAARLFCTETGIDPDEPCSLDNPNGYAVYIRGVRWQRVAMEMARLADLMLSMKNLGVLP